MMLGRLDHFMLKWQKALDKDWAILVTQIIGMVAVDWDMCLPSRRRDLLLQAEDTFVCRDWMTFDALNVVIILVRLVEMCLSGEDIMTRAVDLGHLSIYGFRYR